MLFVSMVLIGFGLFWDRPGFRGRPERWCRRCKYDLTGAGELPVRCTECGREHRMERSLRRVRRHKRYVLLGMLLIVIAPGFALYPDYEKGEVFRRAPNWLLVDLMPFFPTLGEDGNLFIKGNNPGVELTLRFAGAREPLTHAQTRAILDRIATGGFTSTPGSVEWQERVVVWMQGRWQRFHVGDQLKYLDGTPADEALRASIEQYRDLFPIPRPNTRTRWVVGQPIIVACEMQGVHWWAFWDKSIRVRARWEIEETGITGAVPNGLADIPIEADLVAGERYTLRITYELFRTPSDVWTRDLEGEPDRVHTFTRSWVMTDNIDEAIEGVDDEIINTALIEEVVPVLTQDRIASAILNNPRLTTPIFDGLAMAVRVRMSDDEGDIREFTMRWMSESGRLSHMSHGIRYSAEREDNQDRIQAALDNGTLRIHVSGDQAEAMRFIDADRAWVGEFEVLYSDAVKAAELAHDEAADELVDP